MRFRQRQKRLKAGAEFRQLSPAELTVDHTGRQLQNFAQPLIEVFLEACNVDIEPENFRGERVLAGQFLRPLDPPSPC